MSEGAREERGNGRAGRDHGGVGWLGTILGGAVLVVLGFGLGLVVGAAREEPELVLRHLSRDAQEVPAPAAGASPAEPAPAPSSPVPPASDAGEEPSEPAPSAAPERPAPAPAEALVPRSLTAPRTAATRPAAPPAATRHEAAPPATRPAVSAAPPHGGGFSVQVGAFADAPQAEKLAERLRAKGLDVYVAPGTDPRDARWRVRVGPVETRAEADRVAERLKSTENLPTWILAESR